MKPQTLLIWLMFVVIIFYVALDVWQTYLLFQFGAEEYNPIVAYFMSYEHDIAAIIGFKFVTLLYLAATILIVQRRKEDGRFD